jgi:DNA-damage-inducible protein D
MSSKFEFGKVRSALNFADYDLYFSVIDVVAMVTSQPDYDKARKYWNLLKLRLSRFQTRSVWVGETSEINQIELVAKVLNNCNQLKMVGKDHKLHPSDVMAPEILNDLVKLIPSRNKRLFERQFNLIVNEIKNPQSTIDY